MPNNPVRPDARKILEIIPQTSHIWTFRVENNAPIKHGQFMQLSIPRFGEAPISVSGFGDGYADFTIHKVGRVTDELFNLKKGDTIFLRGCYGNGWPVDRLKDKSVVFVAGGTGIAPVKSLLEMLYNNPGYAKSIYLLCGFKSPEVVLFRDELATWEKLGSAAGTNVGDATAPSTRWATRIVESNFSKHVAEHLSEIPFASYGDDLEVVVVGTPAMMKSVGLQLLEDGIPEEKIWMTFERKMSCAVGKCGHCRIDETYVCLDGPVFNYTLGKKLID